MYTIAKTFDFSASHQLPALGPTHKCARLHGHNYHVELLLQAHALDQAGLLYDYGRLAPFKHYLDTTLDHRHLNDILPDHPTAENLARYLFTVAADLLHIPNVAAVRVSETPNTSAEYRP